jgi:hypothetical protein
MSKSLGNVIDPIDVTQEITLEDLLKNNNLDHAEFDIAKQVQIYDFPNGIQQCGTDPLQFSLISYTSQVGYYRFFFNSNTIIFSKTLRGNYNSYLIISTCDLKLLKYSFRHIGSCNG